MHKFANDITNMSIYNTNNPKINVIYEEIVSHGLRQSDGPWLVGI